MEIPEYLPKKWILIRDKFNRDRAGSMYQTIKSVLKSVLHRVCPSLLPPLQKGVRGFRRLIRDDAWLILPAVLPEDMEWLQRLEALATAPPKVKAEQEGGEASGTGDRHAWGRRRGTAIMPAGIGAFPAWLQGDFALHRFARRR